MGEDNLNNVNNIFNISTSLLPDRFSIIGFIQVRDEDYVAIGREYGDFYCTWLYNPNCGFIYGHYRMTKEEAYKDLIERAK